MKKNSLASMFLALLIMLSLTACIGTSSPVVVVPENHPTHFKCFQQGVAIVDVTTIDGATYGWVTIGNGWSSKAWSWKDDSGYHYQTESASMTCQQTGLK